MGGARSSFRRPPPSPDYAAPGKPFDDVLETVRRALE
jgi:hypothetical protein